MQRFGFGILKQSSADFWQMTLSELNHAATAYATKRGQAPDLESLNALMRRFPDQDGAATPQD